MVPKVRFSIRLMFTTMSVVACVAAIVSTYPDLETLPPILLCAVGAASGILWTRGCGTRCLIAATFGSAASFTTWVLYVVWSPTASFFNWYTPLIMIAESGALGLFLGLGVRLIMEGLRVKPVQQNSDKRIQ